MRFSFNRSIWILLITFTSICSEEVGSERKIIKSLSRGGKVKRETSGGNNGSEESETKGITSKISPKLKYLPFELPKNYNKFQIPSFGAFLAMQEEDVLDPSFFQEAAEFLDHPITVTFRISYVNDVDEANEEITFAATLILQWKDHVISKHVKKLLDIDVSDSAEIPEESTDPLFKTLDSEFLKTIWKPDIYIENIVKVQHPEVMSPPVTVRLNEVTGQIIYVSRIRARMECEMDLHYYPADTQYCKVVLRSSSYSKDEVRLDWAGPHGAYLNDCGGPNYDYKIQDVDYEDKHEGYIGNQTREFSTLSFTIVARRKLSYHMVQTFLPSVFFIIITWLCFLVPSRMVEARIGISMTTLLTLTAMFASVRESTPPVSYVRGIDIWMLACIFFVFLTLLEFTLLVWLRHKHEDEDGNEVKKDTPADSVEDEKGSRAEMKPLNENEPTVVTKTHRKLNRRKEITERKILVAEFIEKYAFLIFSVIFIVFCIAYWSWLLIGSMYFGWEVDKDYNCAGQKGDAE